MKQNLEDITVAILAGGLGTRLRSVVGNNQKVMAMVGDKPFLAYILDDLDLLGIHKVILCTGYQGNQIQGVFNNQYKRIELVYSQENEPLGTGGALFNALSFFESEHVMVLNGDSFYQTNLSAFWEFHITKKSAASILLNENPDTSCFGRIEIDKDGFVLSFIEKGPLHSPGWINAGIYLIKKDWLATICPGKISIEKDIFPQWIGKGLMGFPCKGKFLDIGTPSSYSTAEKFFNLKK